MLGLRSAQLNDFLNSPSPPGNWEFFRTRVLWKICRLGLPALKEAVAGGQYDFPRGLFFGGASATRSKQILELNFRRWIRGRHVVHLDFHSGLGDYGKYKLLVSGSLAADKMNRYKELFGSNVELLTGNQGGTAYVTRGDLGQWAAATASDVDYYFLAAEFGTYPIV